MLSILLTEIVCPPSLTQPGPRGYAMALAGRYEDGVALVESALRASPAMPYNSPSDKDSTDPAHGFIGFWETSPDFIPRFSQTALNTTTARPCVGPTSGEFAHCHLGLGKLHRRTSKHEQARESLTTAMAMYREMGMTYWLEQAAA